MVGRGRLLVVNIIVGDSGSAKRCTIAFALQQWHVALIQLFQEDHLFSRTGQGFFLLLRFFPFFFFSLIFFGTRLLTLRNLRYVATCLNKDISCRLNHLGKQREVSEDLRQLHSLFLDPVATHQPVDPFEITRFNSDSSVKLWLSSVICTAAPQTSRRKPGPRFCFWPTGHCLFHSPQLTRKESSVDWNWSRPTCGHVWGMRPVAIWWQFP